MGEIDLGWLRGKLGLVLMGGAMLSKYLIQFSVDGWSCVPFLLFDLRPNYSGGNEDNGDLLQKVPCMHCCTQGLQPCSRVLLTHTSAGDSWTLTDKSGSVPCGPLLLSSGSWCAQGFICALQEFVSPVLCKFWWLYGGDHGDLLQEGLCHTRCAAPRAPAPVAGHCWCVPLQETPKHSSGSVSVRVSGSCYAQDLFEPSDHLWWVWGLILNMISPLLPSWWGLSFALGCGVSFLGGIQHSPVDSCSAVSCNFGVLAGEDEHTSSILPS